MKFKCGPTLDEKVKARRASLPAIRATWYKEFAWVPVRISSGDCRWLEHYWARYPEAWVGEYTGRIYLGDNPRLLPKEKGPPG